MSAQGRCKLYKKAFLFENEPLAGTLISTGNVKGDATRALYIYVELVDGFSKKTEAHRKDGTQIHRCLLVEFNSVCKQNISEVE